MAGSTQLTQALPAQGALPAPVGGQCDVLQTRVGPLAVYSSQPLSVEALVSPTPVLLIHSINASASAFEVAPLYEHFRRTRPTYALDLPGYGLSDRSDRAYSIRLMTDAVLAVLAHMRNQHGGSAVDVLAVSLSGEYAARAACEAPDAVRRLALVSPTGFSGRKCFYGAPGSSRGIKWLHEFLANPRWSNGLYRTLTRPGVIRYFLERTWGSKNIDEALWRYDLLTTQQPGARYAPLYFLSAHLFAADINTLYEKLACPVWVSMATRGDFTDYRGRFTVAHRANWQFCSMPGGALPYFEDLAAFTAKIDPFLE